MEPNRVPPVTTTTASPATPPMTHAEIERFLRAGAPEAVVSIRQYQEFGPSNIHLYLYTMYGRLVRQLTDNPELDEVSPMFDRTGKSVLFFRRAITPDLKAKEGCYVLNLRTNKLVKLSPAETKLQEKNREPTLHVMSYLSYLSDKTFQSDPAEGKDATSCQSPDGNYKLIRTNSFTYFMRTRGSSEVVSLDSLPGSPPPSDNDFQSAPLALNGNPFVLTKGSAALFMMRDWRPQSLWMLDLKTKRWTQMTDAFAVKSLGYVSGQFGVTYLGYPLETNFGLNLQCCYLGYWDGAESAASTTSGNLPIRLGPATSNFHGATIFYGAGHTLILPKFAP
jgi:hypothetical protein